MEELQNLYDLVKDLKKATDKKDQVLRLQKINDLLLTDYEIRIGNIIIEPYWVEAYYYHDKGNLSGSFLDLNSHRDEDNQQDNFGCLYFHKSGRGHGRGGMDICLSNGKYYLSFLIKRSLVNGEEWCKQIELKKRFESLYKPKTIAIFPAKKRDITVCHTTRINLARDCYRTEALASFALNAVKEHVDDFRSSNFAKANIEEIILNYITEFKKTHSFEECGKECIKQFGYIPDIARGLLK